MSVAVLLQEPEVLTDKKGNSFRLAISKEQSKLGITSKSEDVFKRIQEKRGKHYRNPSL